MRHLIQSDFHKTSILAPIQTNSVPHRHIISTPTTPPSHSNAMNPMARYADTSSILDTDVTHLPHIADQPMEQTT